jgi:hypothetical protein
MNGNMTSKRRTNGTGFASLKGIDPVGCGGPSAEPPDRLWEHEKRRNMSASSTLTRAEDLGLETQGFYRRVVQMLNGEGVPFLVGGAYALAYYTGIVRHTKDFDIFVRPGDCRRVLRLLEQAGYPTDLTFPHWLGKAFHGEDFIDVIFSSGNGVCKVDDLWFDHSMPARFLQQPIRLCPVEEMIWSKSFVCERERFDGADINHLLRAYGRGLDWHRLVDRFGPYWRMLLAHLVFFGFVYPSERDVIPDEVLSELMRRCQDETSQPPPARRVCQGTLLSRTQYVIDLEDWDYTDARLDSASGMTPEQASFWSEAGLQDQKK